MKKLLMTFLVLAFVGTAWIASADHWIGTGVFDPGFYIVCLVGNNGGDPAHCIMTIADGSKEEVQSNVDALNEDPLSTPYDDYITIWYHWDSGYWIKYKVPWKFVEGIPM